MVELAGLLAELARTPTLPGAACRQEQAVFDGDDTDAQLAVCRHCPALADCHSWVAGLPADRRPGGVVGGVVWPVPLTADDPGVTVAEQVRALAWGGLVTADSVATALAITRRRARVELARHPQLHRVGRGVYALKGEPTHV